MGSAALASQGKAATGDVIEIRAVARRGGVAVGPRGNAVAYRSRTVVRGPGARRCVVRPGYRGGGVRWARPAAYGWPRGGAIAAGAAIGFVTAATAAAWAGAARRRACAGTTPILPAPRGSGTTASSANSASWEIAMSQADAEAERALAGRSRTGDMVWIPGGTFRMGSDHHYPEEAPVHRVSVDGFWIDRTPVTNRQFKEFVKATGHVTIARDSARPEGLSRRAAAHDLCGLAGVRAAAARHRSARLEPVVDLHEGRRLAASLRAEEQHQRARQPSGRARLLFAMRWPMRNGPARICRPKPNGSSPRAAGSTAPSSPGATSSRPAACTWPTPGRANFPRQNLNDDGYERTSPVTAFPPNGYGVHDMIGNVWEWTSDWYAPKHEADAPKACCIPQNPRGGREEASYDPRQPNIRIPRKVIKGGSHLCAPNYCRRYRPAARHAEAIDTSTSHVGFRCVMRSPAAR